MIHIILADDHQAIRNGIKNLLEKEQDILVTGEVDSGQGALDLLNLGVKADLLLVDLHMPGMGGLELTKIVKQKFPLIKVVILSMADHEKLILEAFDNGACAYLLKTIDREELLTAIRHTFRGKRYLSVELGLNMLKTVANDLKRSLPSPDVEIQLNDQEKNVLSLIAEGYSNLEIAAELFVSKRTVEAHRYNLMGKMGVKNTATMIRYAFRNGLIN